MRTMRMSRALGTFALLGLLSPCLAIAAEPVPGAWDGLDRLHAGQKVEVVQKNAERVKGNFVVFTADSVAVRSLERDVEINRADVREVRIPSVSARWKHALVGAAAIAAAVGTAGVAGFVLATPMLGFGGLAPAYSVIYAAPHE